MFTMFSGIISSMMFLFSTTETLSQIDRIGLRIGAVSGLVLSLGGLVTAIGTQIVAYRKLLLEQDRLRNAAYHASVRAHNLEKVVEDLQVKLHGKVDKSAIDRATVVIPDVPDLDGGI